jgi:hypothetical protein
MKRSISRPAGKSRNFGGTVPRSRDSKWAAYLINPPKTEAEKLRKEKKPVPSAAQPAAQDRIIETPLPSAE